ncbi:MAG: type II toxin-antitoxin system PemK/MazF family toxin [Anaerolineaceae bacterium]|nr:type II toxin-antitoxin system PemK/MazF family toxin [Anaerolineaceae bacterium]
MFRCEVWLINLDPTVGAEIKKARPVVIVSSDTIGILPLRLVVPLTDWKDHYYQAAWMVKISPNQNNGLIKDSAADTFQIRSVSTTRFIRKMGEITKEEIDQIVHAIGLVVEYQPLD